MTNEDIFEAIGGIDGCYISEAYGVRRRKSKKRNYRLIAAAAAAALAVVVGGWTVLSRPFLVFNGGMNELDIDVMYEARILTAEELEALGGVPDPDFKASDGLHNGLYNFENASLNELFSAMNISPLRSSRVDYDNVLYAETGVTEYGISSLAYTAEDSAAGKRFRAQLTWYNTAKGLSMGETYMMMKNYETYTLACGAEAMISLPEPGTSRQAAELIPEEERTEEQQQSIDRTVPDAFTWIWFTHNNIAYFIRTQHDSEEAKAFLDSFS